MLHGITSQRRDVTRPLLVVLKMMSYNGFAAKIIQNRLKTLNKQIFGHCVIQYVSCNHDLAWAAKSAYGSHGSEQLHLCYHIHRH
jgi:hypothetical protein